MLTIENVRQLTVGKKNYPIELEIAGDFAMFARPDSGSEKTSEIAPPFSAAKGIIESIFYLPTVHIIPTRVEICKPIEYQRWTFNYRGTLRKHDLISKDNACQIRFLVLRNVCYKIYASVVNNHNAPNGKHSHVNNAHHFQERFNRRLRRKQSFRKPVLGISEFHSSYFGPLRAETSPCSDINQSIKSMLFMNFDQLNNGKFQPLFRQNVQICNGVLNYVK